jgi:glycosyltransferase involved in cell wall biosynthesis
VTGPAPKEGRSILLVSQASPPALYSAARRIAGLTKYLQRLGHDVTVLTSLASGSGPIAGARRTVRTRDLVSTPVNPRRARFEAIQGRATANGNGSRPTSFDTDYDGGHSPVAFATVPDLALIGWLPFALPRALALASERPFDCVITSSPPESAHLIGLALKRRGLPWIADFRDGWSFESTRPDFPLAAQRRLDNALERRIARTADLVMTVSDPITHDLRSRTRAHALTLTNGFDPDDDHHLVELDGLLSPTRHTLLHTGRMAFSGRSPQALLDALALLAADSPALAERLDVALAGPLSRAERAAADRVPPPASVRAVGMLDHRQAIAFQRAADSLLLITGGRRRGEATGKLYEYLAAGKQILVLGERSAAATIVRETGSGFVVPHDSQAIATALRAMVNGSAIRPDRDAIARYSYPQLATELAGHVEAAITSAAGTHATLSG